MKSLYYSIIAIFIFSTSIIVLTNAFAQNDTSTYSPPNDLGSGNVFSMVVTGQFLPGQLVEINGNLITVNSIQIVLDDPHEQIVTSKTTFSDRDGYFTSELKIPSDAIAGIWKIVGTSGIYHKELNFTIAGNSDTVTCYAGNLCSKPLGITTACCLLHGSNSTNILQSPLKQFKSGIAAKDVKCKQGLELLMKSHDNMPACVKSTSIQRLLGQGWINPYNFNGEYIGKESIILSAYQGVSNEAFYNNGTVASNFTINVNINNFKPSNASLVLQVYYGDGMLYETVSIPSDTIQSDGFYKYHLIAMSDKNHPVPFKVVATYNKETAMVYVPVFAHP